MMPIDTVLIAVTYACQCDCVHCGAALSRDAKRKELTQPEIEGLIEECTRLKARSVAFFGGEPLLRKDLVQLIGFAHERGFCTNVDTNGYLLTKALAGRLKQAGLDIVGVSIDASVPEVHDALRGLKGLHARAVEGIRHCKEVGIACYVSTYATHENVEGGDLLRVIELARVERADWIRVCAPFAAGKWLACTDKRLTPDERRVVEKIADADPDFVVLEDHEACPAMKRTLVYVSAYGDVQPCCYVPVTVGNVRDEPLSDIVARLDRHPMYERFGGLTSCPMNSDSFRREYIEPPLTTRGQPLRVVVTPCRGGG